MYFTNIGDLPLWQLPQIALGEGFGTVEFIIESLDLRITKSLERRFATFLYHIGFIRLTIFVFLNLLKYFQSRDKTSEGYFFRD